MLGSKVSSLELVSAAVHPTDTVADYFKTIISIIACALKIAGQPKRVARVLMVMIPYITLLVSFAAFVLWNGSVVLGDKSNHVATLHTPQMLYIWPLIAFFSWPLLYPYLLALPVFILVRAIAALESLETTQIFKRRTVLPRLWLAVLAVASACVAVFGNTVVHPFTTADNRHYVFYIFRYLLRPWWARYAVTPIYVLCGWACVQALGDGPPAPYASDKAATKTKSRLALPNGHQPATTSFVLIWIGTSALQLITAPLVEPRYFILPWVFWRMHFPLRTPPEPHSGSGRAAGGWSWRNLWEDYDHRLWLESAWLLAVNAITGYIFLNWGFEWPQEPGKVQRFMW